MRFVLAAERSATVIKLLSTNTAGTDRNHGGKQMPDYSKELKNTLNNSDSNKILTANGAVSYASSNSRLVDFWYSVNSLRNKPAEDIARKFEECYIDAPLLTTKMLFQMADVRGGKGERRLFDVCIERLSETHPEIVKYF